MREKFIVTATPPTTNGDLHIGHIAGPYLGADVFSRFQRLKGSEVIYVSGADNNQSYVVTTSEKLSRDPVGLCEEFTDRIKGTLKKAAIDIDAFTSPDYKHEEFVKSFFNDLHEKNAFVCQTKDIWYSEEEKRYLFESYISGFCPTCSEPTKGGICESCGHPNDLTDLVLPKCSISQSGNISKRKIKGLFFELEKFRPQLRAFYDSRKGIWRRHILALVDELLAERLIDYPITYPSSWGIKFPHGEFRDTVINVWAEMLPGLIHSTRIAKNLDGGRCNIWHKQSGYKLVQFLGYDNSFFFAVLHLALLIASGKEWILPDYIITNEFYLLDYRKFSTSQGHVVWARDILETVPCDELRFYLCFSNPEMYQTNFSEHEMRNFSRKMLVEPLGKLMFQMSTLFEGKKGISLSMNDTSELLQKTVGRYYKLLEESFSPATFSLCGASRTLAAFISWLVRYAEESRGVTILDQSKRRKSVVDMAYALLALIAFSSPIMPNLSQKLKMLLGISAKMNWDLPMSVDSMNLAALPEDVKTLLS
ncbi:MAG: class I tRNA ligase family protein [Nitrososphaera sp.]